MSSKKRALTTICDLFLKGDGVGALTLMEHYHNFIPAQEVLSYVEKTTECLERIAKCNVCNSKNGKVNFCKACESPRIHYTMNIGAICALIMHYANKMPDTERKEMN